MGNSVARRRRRPRVASVSFLSFWWLVRREAAFQILWGNVSASLGQRVRVGIARRDCRYLVREVARHLRTYPGRRFTP